MKKNATIVLQCADCDTKYKKTIKWLENAEKLDCRCHSTLDIYELITEIHIDKKQEIYTAYSR